MTTRKGTTRFTVLGALAVVSMIGCQTPITSTQATMSSTAEAPMAATEQVGSGGMETWASEDVAITPAGDRQVQQLISTRWLSGDRIRIGSRSSFFGDEPLGFGFLRNGLLPFLSRRGLGGGRGFFLYDAREHTVFEVPALSDLGIRDASLSRGGRFITFVDRDGDISIYDLRTHLIRTFPHLRSRSLFGTGRFGRFSRLGSFGLLQTSGSATNDDDDRWDRLFDVDTFGNLVFVDNRGDVRLFDTRTGEEFIVPAAGRGLSDIRDVSISGRGDLLVLAGRDRGGRSGLFAVDLARGRQFTIPFTRSRGLGRISNVSVSADGDRILYTENGIPRLLDLRTGFTENLVLLGGRGSFLGGFGDVDDVQFLDDDGDLIAFERNGNIGVFDRSSGLIDTLPILNRGLGLSSFRDRFSFGSLFD